MSIGAESSDQTLPSVTLSVKHSIAIHSSETACDPDGLARRGSGDPGLRGNTVIPRRTFLKGLGLATIVGAFCPLELAPKSIATPSRELVREVPLPLVLVHTFVAVDMAFPPDQKIGVNTLMMLEVGETFHWMAWTKTRNDWLRRANDPA